jgi:hypothetical protein
VALLRGSRKKGEEPAAPEAARAQSCSNL